MFCQGSVFIYIHNEVRMKGLIHLLDGIKLMALWPGPWGGLHVRLTYFQHACKRYKVYSLDPTTDLFIGLYWGLYKEGVHLLPQLVVSGFQIQWNLWQQFQLTCFQKLTKIKTLFTRKLPKLAISLQCNRFVTFSLLPKMKTFVCKSISAPPINTL